MYPKHFEGSMKIMIKGIKEVIIIIMSANT